MARRALHRRRRYRELEPGRTVISCRNCGRSSAWRGEEHARAQGWTAIPGPRSATRTWACKLCYRPDLPPLQPRPPHRPTARTLEGLRLRSVPAFRQVVAEALELFPLPPGLWAIACRCFAEAVEAGEPTAIAAAGLIAAATSLRRRLVRAAAAQKALLTRAERIRARTEAVPCSRCRVPAASSCRGKSPCRARVRDGLAQAQLFHATAPRRKAAA